MFKMIILNTLIQSIFSQVVIPGSQVDNHNCMLDGGYTWCSSSRECIRMWETPCPDNYLNCGDCLAKQSDGINIACPSNCDIIRPPPIVIDPLPPPCPEVMCMMYCENGYRRDSNGCSLCYCNEIVTPIAPPTAPACLIEPPSCDQYTYICPRITEITTCSEGGIAGHTTYQISIILKQDKMIKNFFAIYGDEMTDKMMILPPAMNINSVFGANVGGISPEIIQINPDSRYDSWVTIGETEGNINNNVNTIGISFDEWSETRGMSIMNGAIFLMNPDITMNIGVEIVVGQFTIRTGTTESVILNFQGKYTDEHLRGNIVDNSWREEQVEFILIPVTENNIPNDCIMWYDGCNQCVVNNGVIGGCTKLMCFTEDEPNCLNYKTSGH